MIGAMMLAVSVMSPPGGASRGDDGSTRADEPVATAGAPTFDAIYDAWFHEVCRWARAQGCPDAELEDVAQEVFLVVRRKLGAFDGRNLPGWLYRITANTVSDQRRRSWFKHLFQRPREVELDEVPETVEGPDELLERKQARQILRRVLGEMSEKRRTAFVLFEIEGYSGEEIAALLDVPVATVWTRLHHARKDFEALAAELAAAPEGSR